MTRNTEERERRRQTQTFVSYVIFKIKEKETASNDSGMQWFWKSDSHWEPYAANTNAQIETAYNQNVNEVKLTKDWFSGNRGYVIDFVWNQQVNHFFAPALHLRSYLPFSAPKRV